MHRETRRGQELGLGRGEGCRSGNTGSRVGRPVIWRDGAHIPSWVMMPVNLALTWAGSPPSLDHARFWEQRPVALLLVGQGVQKRERERERARPLGPARPLPCLPSPLQMRRGSPLHLRTARHVGFSSPTRDQTPAPFSGSTESFFFFFNYYLFTWLHQVLVVAGGLLSWGTWAP